MAEINKAITLIDGVSATLSKIDRGLNSTIAGFGNLDHASKVDFSKFNSGFSQMQTQLNKVRDQVFRFAESNKLAMTKVQNSHKLAMERVQNSHSLAMTKMQGRLTKHTENHKLAMDKVQNSHKLAMAKMQQDHGRSMAKMKDQASKYADHNGSAMSKASKGAGGLIGKIGALAGKYVGLQGVMAGLSMVDNLTNAKARLGLIVREGETVDQLKPKIMAISESSRTSYMDNMNTVSKLGLLAGKSFSSNDELIGFTELMNKSFRTGDAGSQEQLVQAMGTGSLQGEEYRSVEANAPILAQSMEKQMRSMGFSGTMQELAAEGLLTSDVIKAAMFNAADEINTKFEAMPRTWADVVNTLKNRAFAVFESIADKVSGILDSSGVDTFINGITSAFSFISGIAMWLFDVIIGGITLIKDFISANLQPILFVLSATLIYFFALLMRLGVQAMITGIRMFVGFVLANLPLIAIIAAITLLLIGLKSIGISFSDVFGFIGKVVGSTIAAIVNIFIDFWNFLAGFVNNFARIFDDPIAGIVGLFVKLGKFIIDVLSDVANVIDTIFGTSISDTLSGFGDKIQGWYDDTFGETEEYVKTLEHVNADDWAKKGEEFGKQFGAFLDDPSALLNGLNLSGGLPGGGFGGDLGGGLDKNNLLLEDIANNTSTSSDPAEDTLKYLREISERRGIDRYAATNITIDMSGANYNVAADYDLDGIVDYLAGGIQNALAVGGEA